MTHKFLETKDVEILSTSTNFILHYVCISLFVRNNCWLWNLLYYVLTETYVFTHLTWRPSFYIDIFDILIFQLSPNFGGSSISTETSSENITTFIKTAHLNLVQLCSKFKSGAIFKIEQKQTENYVYWIIEIGLIQKL